MLQRQARVTKLARMGRTSKAHAALTSAPVAPKSDAVLEKLRQKHPQGKPIAARNVPSTGHKPFTPADVWSGVRSFQLGSAGGQTGLRPDHLKAALDCESERVAPMLALVVDVLAKGSAPRELAPWLAGARLTALKKKDDDVRPIACGETLRRLVGKVLSARHRRTFENVLLKGNQVGVSVKGGAEAMTSVVANYAKRHEGSADAVVLKIDYANAFNSIDRDTFLAAVQARTPKLLPFAQWCYREESHLCFGDALLTSSCGVQQGDPLGPLFFSLGIADLAEAVKRMPGIEASCFYLDDGVVMGPAAAVSNALRVITERSDSKGLKVKPTKCELVVLGQQSDAELTTLGYDVSEATGVKVIRGGNFDLLGAPIGSAAFCEEYMAAKVLSMQESLEAISSLPDKQVGLTLLRHCEGFARMVFYMRAIGCVGATEYLDRSDAAVEKCLASLLGFQSDRLPLRGRVQAALPVRRGGLGIRRSADHWHCAALAATSGAYSLCTKLDPEFRWDDAGWKRTAELYNVVVAEEWAVEASARPEYPLEQRQLSLGVVCAEEARLREEGDARDLARLNTLTLPHAGAWLCGKLEPATAMGPEVYVTAVRARLGLPLFEQGDRCRQCGSELDAEGVHAMTCGRGAGPTKRHDAVRDALAQLARSCGLSVQVEATHLMEDNKRPGDVYLPNGLMEGCGRAIDVAVSCGVAPSYVQAVARSRQGATVVHESRKVTKYSQYLAAKGVRFSPFALDIFGGLGEAAASLFGRLARLSAERAGGQRIPHTQEQARSLSVAYQRAFGATVGACGELTSVCVLEPVRERVPLDKDHGIGTEEGVIRFDADWGAQLAGPFVDVVPEEVVSEGREAVEAEEELDEDPPPRDYKDIVTMWRSAAVPEYAEGFAALQSGLAARLPAVVQVGFLGGVPSSESLQPRDGVEVTAELVSLELTAAQCRRQAIARVRRVPELLAEVRDYAAWQVMKSTCGEDAASWADVTLLRGLAGVLQVALVLFRDFQLPLVCPPDGSCNEVVCLFGAGAGYVGAKVPAGKLSGLDVPRQVLQAEVVRPRMLPTQGLPGSGRVPCVVCMADVATEQEHWRCGHCHRASCMACSSATHNVCVCVMPQVHSASGSDPSD